MTHASGDLDDDAWVVHRGEKDSYAHVRVSGQWVIKALQHNKLSNIGPSPRVRECTVLGPTRRIWRDNPGKSRHMVCAIYIGAYDIYHWHVEVSLQF